MGLPSCCDAYLNRRRPFTAGGKEEERLRWNKGRNYCGRSVGGGGHKSVFLLLLSLMYFTTSLTLARV